jgi:hypothetical protein
LGVIRRRYALVEYVIKVGILEERVGFDVFSIILS